MVTAIYPGTFDPVTLGHMDIIKRASLIFDNLVVAVYNAPMKKAPLFDTKERVNLLEKAAAPIPNVAISSYSGLTVDFARDLKAQVIVRGLRMGSDFEYEFEMALMNNQLAPDLDVVCLMTGLAYQFISSSLLKEVAALGGNIENFVPPHVAAALEQKLVGNWQSQANRKGPSSRS